MNKVKIRDAYYTVDEAKRMRLNVLNQLERLQKERDAAAAACIECQAFIASINMGITESSKED